MTNGEKLRETVEKENEKKNNAMTTADGIELVCEYLEKDWSVFTGVSKEFTDPLHKPDIINQKSNLKRIVLTMVSNKWSIDEIFLLSLGIDLRIHEIDTYDEIDFDNKENDDEANEINDEINDEKMDVDNSPRHYLSNYIRRSPLGITEVLAVRYAQNGFEEASKKIAYYFWKLKRLQSKDVNVEMDKNFEISMNAFIDGLLQCSSFSNTIELDATSIAIELAIIIYNGRLSFYSNVDRLSIFGNKLRLHCELAQLSLKEILSHYGFCGYSDYECFLKKFVFTRKDIEYLFEVMSYLQGYCFKQLIIPRRRLALLLCARIFGYIGANLAYLASNINVKQEAESVGKQKAELVSKLIVDDNVALELEPIKAIELYVSDKIEKSISGEDSEIVRLYIYSKFYSKLPLNSIFLPKKMKRVFEDWKQRGADRNDFGANIIRYLMQNYLSLNEEDLFVNGLDDEQKCQICDIILEIISKYNSLYFMLDVNSARKLKDMSQHVFQNGSFKKWCQKEKEGEAGYYVTSVNRLAKILGNSKKNVDK